MSFPQNLGEAYFTCIAYGSCGLLKVCAQFIRVSLPRPTFNRSTCSNDVVYDQGRSLVEIAVVSVAEKLGYNFKPSES